MKKVLTIAATAFLLGGCSVPGAFDMFKMDEAHEKSVEQLRTGSIIQSMETKALVSAIYLNPVYPLEYKDDEYFVLAVYFEKTIQDTSKWSIEEHGYTLSLNGTAPVSVERLQENDPRRKLIPVQNNWNKYYLVKFSKIKDSVLKLQLENNQTGSVVLIYPKDRI